MVGLVSLLVMISLASMALVFMKSRVAALFTVDKQVWMLVALRCLITYNHQAWYNMDYDDDGDCVYELNPMGTLKTCKTSKPVLVLILGDIKREWKTQ